MAKKMILIVDDEASIRKTLRIRLESDDFFVLEAEDGAKAIKVLKENKPDLIILDIMMPQMDGIQVSEFLRADPVLSKIPIIFLTALQTPGDEKRSGLKVGDHLVFPKPYKAEVLIQKIYETLGG